MSCSDNEHNTNQINSNLRWYDKECSEEYYLTVNKYYHILTRRKYFICYFVEKSSLKKLNNKYKNIGRKSYIALTSILIVNHILPKERIFDIMNVIRDSIYLGVRRRYTWVLVEKKL